MPRFHALNGMAVLVHVENPLPDSKGIQRIHSPFPVLMIYGRVWTKAYATKSLSATHVVHAIHQLTPFIVWQRQSWRLC